MRSTTRWMSRPICPWSASSWLNFNAGIRFSKTPSPAWPVASIPSSMVVSSWSSSTLAGDHLHIRSRPGCLLAGTHVRWSQAQPSTRAQRWVQSQQRVPALDATRTGLDINFVIGPPILSSLPALMDCCMRKPSMQAQLFRASLDSPSIRAFVSNLASRRRACASRLFAQPDRPRAECLIQS